MPVSGVLFLPPPSRFLSFWQPVDESFTAECDHRVCGTCQLEHICSKLRERQVASGQLTCVLCRQDLTDAEVIGTLTAHGEDGMVDMFWNVLECSRMEWSTCSRSLLLCALSRG